MVWVCCVGCGTTLEPNLIARYEVEVAKMIFVGAVASTKAAAQHSAAQKALEQLASDLMPKVARHNATCWDLLRYVFWMCTFKVCACRFRNKPKMHVNFPRWRRKRMLEVATGDDFKSQLEVFGETIKYETDKSERGGFQSTVSWCDNKIININQFNHGSGGEAPARWV